MYLYTSEDKLFLNWTELKVVEKNKFSKLKSIFFVKTLVVRVGNVWLVVERQTHQFQFLAKNRFLGLKKSTWSKADFDFESKIYLVKKSECVVKHLSILVKYIFKSMQINWNRKI